MKKRNNPWYYYLNGELVKKRKPAMPGDIVLITKYYSSECKKFVVVGEVYIGGFHDQDREYYPWDEVVEASKLLDELSDLRNFKKNCNRYTELVSEDLKIEIDKLQEDLEFAWNQVHDYNQDIKIKNEEMEKMKKQIKDLQEINGWLLSNYSTTSKK